MPKVDRTHPTSHAGVKGEFVGKHVPPDGTGWNRMQDAENRLIAEPAPIGTDRLGGQRCKYAEKSYRYKYDLGHRFQVSVVVVVALL